MRRARALSLVACALIAAQAADASFFVLGTSDAAVGATTAHTVATLRASKAAAVAPAAVKPTAAATAAPPKTPKKQPNAATTTTTMMVPANSIYFAPAPSCGPDKPCPDVAMACCGGSCLDTSRGGVACVDDAPCPSAGVCAAPPASPGRRAAATCCLFPGVCVGGRACCAARARVCGTKCCPEGYACLAGACAPAGCKGAKVGVAFAPPAGGGGGGKGGGGEKTNGRSSNDASPSASAAPAASISARTALVPAPALPKGLSVQYADEALAAAAGAGNGTGAADVAADVAADARRRAARPFVRVESSNACCALCATVAGCTSFTHGAVVLSTGGDASAASVRTSCELWAEGAAEETEAAPAAAGGAAAAAKATAATPAPAAGRPLANSESASRLAPSPALESSPAPAWVTSGRVPRAASAGEDGSLPARSGAPAALALAFQRAPRGVGTGGGLYGGVFDTHLGDYQGSALRQEHDAAQTPCAKASDAVKAGGRGAEALFNALNPGLSDAPAAAAEAALTLAGYRRAAAALLGTDAPAELAGKGRRKASGTAAAPTKKTAAAAAKEADRRPRQEAGAVAAAADAAGLAADDAAPPDPCGASLALMTSTWLAGGTLLEAGGGSDGASVGTVRACCELCGATGGCQYWTFSTVLSSCWLRSGVGAGAAPAPAPALALDGAASDGAAGAAAAQGASAASQLAGGGPLSSVPCRYSISGAMQGAPSPGLCAAALVCRGAPTEALPDGAASCCPMAGWLCSSAGVCCPPGSKPCGSQCGCPLGAACLAGGCQAQQQIASVLSPQQQQQQPQGQVSFQQFQQPQFQPQQQQVLAQQPAWQSQLLQFEGERDRVQQAGVPPPGAAFAPGGGGASNGGGLVFSPNGGAPASTFSADAPRFGYYGRSVVDGAALVTDASDPQACRQRPAEGAAAFRFGRAVALNSGGALNRNAPAAQATAADCCLACGGIGNCDAFSWDGTTLGCFFWTNKINGVLQQRLETPQKGAVVGDMVRSLSFRADGTPVPRLDDACRAPCGPSDGSRPALCCVDGRETCLSPSGVGVGGDRHQCCANPSVCGGRCGCDPGSICVAGNTCCPGERVCGSLCCAQGQVCGASGACGAPAANPGLFIVDPQPYGWNRGGWWGGYNNWNGGGGGGWNGVANLPVRSPVNVNVFGG